DAIGYFRIKLPGGNEDVSWPDPKSVGLDFTLIGPARSAMLLNLVRERSDSVLVDLTVPYEWFEKRQSPDVLVLWLNEDKFTTRPLIKLRSLIAELTPAQASSQPTPRKESEQNLPIPAKIFVPTATIPNCDLDAAMAEKQWDCFTMDPPVLPKKFTDLSIVRT